MSLIQVLDDNTINKIAAGEVVERPASVVKELVENSIDAGASRIEVEIMNGGISFIRVSDNGCGMSRQDASLAILRHATSKIREASDLTVIGTLGFRGEAVPTIASVSRFNMLTRPAGCEFGTSITITGGKEPDIMETGCSIGTTIKVEDLFFNTPARKKFLKTPHTEGGKISDFIVKLALSYPEISFRFINNNKQAMVTPGSGSLFDTVKAIYGKAVADSLLALDFHNEIEGLDITGYITKPSLLKSSRAWQTFIVNGRVINNRAMAKAIDNSYRSLVPKNGYPLAVVKVKLPSRSIDVNVHPQKTEIKFEDEGLIFKAVYKAVIDAIRPTGQGLTQVAAAVEKPKFSSPMEQLQPSLLGLEVKNSFSREAVSRPEPWQDLAGDEVSSHESLNTLTSGEVSSPEHFHSVTSDETPSPEPWNSLTDDAVSRTEPWNSLTGDDSPSDNAVLESPAHGNYLPQDNDDNFDFGSSSIYRTNDYYSDSYKAPPNGEDDSKAAHASGEFTSLQPSAEDDAFTTRKLSYSDDFTSPRSSLVEDDYIAAGEADVFANEPLVPIGQIDKTYIVAQTTHDLYLIDQHAAHERILFDKFSAEADGIPSQVLLMHLIISFDQRECQLIEDHKEVFDNLGFVLEPCGGRDYRLTAVPADIPSPEADTILRSIFMSLHDMHDATAKDIRQAGLAMTACKAAIKAGEVLSMTQMRVLLEALAETPFPYTCPHGRPTIIKFSTHDLAKMFKRTGFNLTK